MDVENIVLNLRMLGKDDQTVEAKEGVGKSILETLSAFANSGGGIVLVGISESQGFQIVPGFDAKQAADQIRDRGEQITPPVRPTISIVPFEGGDLVVAEVDGFPSQDKPAYVTNRGMYGGSFQRVGDADIRLTQYEVDRMREERTQPRWDEQPVPGARLADLNSGMLESFVAKQRSSRPKTFADGDTVALQRLRVLRGEELTLAALLAMGDYPQEYYPRLTVAFSVYPGTSKGDVTTGFRFLDRKTVSGSIPEIVETTVELVSNNMRSGALIGDVFRKEIQDYPLVAVREAIVNALMHRDYSEQSQGSQVQVNMFVDRLEIMSPGGLYGGVTLQTLGEVGASSTRNQRLATFLESVEFPGGGIVAEGRGTGLAVIGKSLAENLQPEPSFRADLNSFTITFYRRRVAPQEKYATAEDRVRQVFSGVESASTTELVSETGLSRTAVQKAINKLIDEDFLEPTEPHRSPRQRYRRL
ncbi:MAG: ATP-binding protein [Actinomycetaceae bacterium]|nr:ATP-binding protein [Actinomycetaceae bacterium]